LKNNKQAADFQKHDSKKGCKLFQKSMPLLPYTGATQQALKRITIARTKN